MVGGSVDSPGLEDINTAGLKLVKWVDKDGALMEIPLHAI